MKQGDLQPPYRAYLSQQVDGITSTVDLTGTTVTFVMIDAKTNQVVINSPAVIESAANGIVRYDWVAGDTDTIGNYKILIKVLFLSGLRTYPSNGYDYLTIEQNFGG